MSDAEPALVIVCLVLALLGIAAASVLGRRTGVAAPLLLVGAGTLVGFLPGVPAVDVEPEWILTGVLPPLLYSAATSMPTMSFRREFKAIAGLSVTLVVVSSVLLGLFFAWALNLSLAWGIALGAVVSPTDAVATAIAKRVGVPSKVLTLLEGEGLLNDATALVLLRSAVAAGGASIALGPVVWDFVLAVVLAVIVGLIVGHANIWARARIREPAVATAISFVTPFVAALPAEEVQASGLVAAVVAGLVTGHSSARRLSPQVRATDAVNWQTLELILEGLIFLVMGLQLHALVDDTTRDHGSLSTVVWVAGLGLVGTLLVRTGYVGLLVASVPRKLRRVASRQERLVALQEYVDQRLADPDGEIDPPPPTVTPGSVRERRSRRRATKRYQRGQSLSSEQWERFGTRLRRAGADVDYLLADPIGVREGAIIVWAGMRGAVSLAAAQTLPADTPGRAQLVLVAFVIAFASLLLQGSSLPWVVRRLVPEPTEEQRQQEREDRARLLEFLDRVAERKAAEDPGRTDLEARLTVTRAQREALLHARDDGMFDAESLGHALTVIDARQIGLEMMGDPAR